MQNHPTRPMPKLLYGYDTPFTHDTIVQRLPDIVQRVLAENELPQTAVNQLNALLNEIMNGVIRPLPPHLAPDLIAWQAEISNYEGQPWLDVPWFFAETYFYRRIVAAVDYFRSGTDPFWQQKQQSLQTSIKQIQSLAIQLNQMIPGGWQAASFRQLLLADLWGNQADMSLWAAGDDKMPNHADAADRLAHLLVDDGTAVQTLLQKPINQIDFIIDNAGFELIGDLFLADYLLATSQTANVCFQLKLFPTFVSDATLLDVEGTVAFLRENDDPELRQAGERLTNYLLNGRLQLTTHPFWTSPHPLWQLPAELHKTLATTDLIISKGDANYRRALGDAQWAFHTPFADVVSYLPAPALFLRTCKSPVLAGLAKGRASELDQIEEDWLINGRWGVIQMTPVHVA